MRKALQLILALVLVMGIPISVKAAPTASPQPVVQIILFYSTGCPYCNQVLTSTMPALVEKYQSQVSILLVDVATMEDVNSLYALGAELGLSKEQVAVPFLLIDHTALVGVDEIDNKLPGLIDQYLSAGGIGYPSLKLLDGMLTHGIDFASYDPYTHLVPSAAPNATGMTLAWVILVIMILALLLAIGLVLRAFQGKPLGKLNNWLDWVIPVLAVVGLGASIYLTYVEITHTTAFCGPVGDCNTVQSSPYARLFGVIPVALLGTLGYIAILVAWYWQRFRKDGLTRSAGPAMYGMALFGVLFSIYLTYLELFVIHAVCIWCLSSAVIITALMLLSLPPVTQWLAISDEEE